MSDNVISLKGESGTHSINNRLIVEPYLTDRALKSKETNGFAMIQQKVAVKGLRLLMDALILRDGAAMILDKGCMIYIREELLHTQPWAQKVLESDAIDGKFIIVDIQHVEFIDPS